MKETPKQLTEFLSVTQWASSTAIIAIIGGSLIHLQLKQLKQLTQLETNRHQGLTKQDYQREEYRTKQSLKLLSKPPSLDFDNLVADWAFLNFIQYFGDSDARPKTGYSVLPSFFDVIVNHDPLFLNMYPYLSSSVTLYAGRPQESIRLLKQGAQAIPSSMRSRAYFLWQAKGTDELLFLGNTQAATQSYEMAVSWASQSNDPQMQEIAQRSRQTAQFLATNPDSRRARVGSWTTY
jgi:hypothetical protein